MGLPLFQRLDAGPQDRLRGLEIGLANAQADHVLHRGRDVEEATDAGWRDGGDALRDEVSNAVHCSLLGV